MIEAADTADHDNLDRQTVHEVLNGNRDAFRLLVERYSGPIYSLALRLSAQPEDAEEAVQEIFSRVYDSLHTFNPEHRFFSWLYSIAVNYMRSRHRSRTGRQNRNTIQLQIFGDAAFLNPTSVRPEDSAVQQAAERAVQAALNQIPAKHKEVFVLRHIQELSSKETAEILGLPENTVKTYLLRARRKLAQILTSWEWS